MITLPLHFSDKWSAIKQEKRAFILNLILCYHENTTQKIFLKIEFSFLSIG